MPATRRPALPRTFVAGAMTWRLTNTVVGWGEATAAAQLGEVSAMTIGSLLLVAVEPGLPVAFERSLVYHELVHVALEVAGWRQAVVKRAELEESVAHALAFVGLAIMRDNPALRAYLFGP